ncbi:aminotransferase class V-fold PLP-dependent enzyme [Acidobacteriota bacterium]
MATRRDFLKTISLSAVALPILPQWDFTNSKVAELVFPSRKDPAFWKKIRKLFPMPLDQSFFNTGTLGAMPTVVLESITDHMRKVVTEIAEWDYKGDDWISGYQPMTELRRKVAELINAETEEIALTGNATMGLNYIANGLELKPGDEVLGTNQEHSGGRSGWRLREKRNGIVYRPIEIPRAPVSPEQVVELIKKAITPKTRVISVSHITSGSGAIFPVKEIAALGKKHNIFTVFDGAQTVGQIPVDVKYIDCDAYFGSQHKWLLAPPGNGFLYIRKERIEEVWTTLASGQWDNHEDDGFRLSQRGTGNQSLLIGLNAAIDFHNRVGPSRIYTRIKYLGDYLRDNLKRLKKVEFLSPTHPDMCAGITAYNIRGIEPGFLMDELWRRKKIRIRGVRQSTHIYNSTEELDATLEIVKELAK